MKHLITITFFLISYFTYAQTFDNMNAGLPGLAFSMSSFGDVDADGDLDLYLSGHLADYSLSGGLYIYDAGTYTLSTTSGLPLLGNGSAKWGDIDGDGDLDIFIQGADANVVGLMDIYLNNNDGTFSAMNLGLPNTYMGEVAFTDFNNDTHLDFAFTGTETTGWTRVTKLYKNNGDTTFTEVTGFSLPAINYGRLKFADYNNDGFPDFAISGINEDSDPDEFYTKIFTNNGDETFTESGVVLYQSWLGDIEWGDYNADGNIDLATSGTGGGGAERKTEIYKNNGDGTFTNINAVLMGVSHSSLEWGDFDNDNDLDILVIGAFTTPGEGNYTYTIYNNDGGDVFSESTTTMLTGSYYGDADTGDIDSDGKIDLVITGYDENDAPASNVFLNTTTVGLEDVLATSFKVYPNPSTAKQIRITYDENQIDTMSILTITTLTGVRVYQDKLTTKAIDLSNLAKGTYLLSITSKNIVISKKLLLR